MDVTAFIEALRAAPGYADQIGHVHVEPAVDPQWAELPDGIHEQTRAFLTALQVSRLYRHQADAIQASREGRDVLVTTGPASGKSLCYQVPVLEALLGDPEATALLIFPAKALAHDQAETWKQGTSGIAPSKLQRSVQGIAFDADASSGDRRAARQTARVIITNPEMMHLRLLPGHARWSRVFSKLRYVIIDEMHSYTGFFGANMANVIRRLDRVCAHYGSRPRFVCMSATVGNPVETAELLTGRTLHHVNEDCAAMGTRTYVFWNPPRIKRRVWRGRRSANVEALELMVRLVEQHTSTICFAKARNTAEMIYRYVRDALRKQRPELAGAVIPYRGGYSAEQRRDMERRLREGRVLGVCATRALELGIDIGSLEACIVVGYPGTLNSFFQQTGRAGRAGRDALCILIGIDTPINQYVMQHPEFVFGRPIEQTVIDRDNPFVVIGHLRCAAAELPVEDRDLERFGYATGMALDVLEESHKLHREDGRWYHAVSEMPASEVRLRGWGDESTVVTDADTGKIIDRIDKFRALRIFYEGAIYFHRGDTYALVSHDTDRNHVLVRRVDVNYYTDPQTGTAVNHIDHILDTKELGTARGFLGEVYAVLDTPTYEKVQFYTLDRISQHPTNLPSVAYEAMAFWLTPPQDLIMQVDALGMSASSGCNGILYCVSRILPLFHTSDSNDFDWSQGCRNSTDNTMFWFEFYLHGIGHAEQCYERLEEILALTLEHLLTCDCEDGCPNCTSRLITPYHTRNIELGEGNVESRRAAVLVLNGILTGQSVQESLVLLDTPREKRGMQYLPAITGERRESEPHRMPLNERTRTLMVRKLERSRNPKQDLDHPINLRPEVGVPEREADHGLQDPDAVKRTGAATLIRRGDPLQRKLRNLGKPRPKPVESDSTATDSPEETHSDKAANEPSRDTLSLGDSLASRARRLKRHRKDT